METMLFEKYICLLVWLSGVREGFYILLAVRLMPPDSVFYF